MSFLKKLFRNKTSDSPSEPAKSHPHVAASLSRARDVTLADQPIDCSGVDWNGDAQLRFVDTVARSVGERLDPTLASGAFNGNLHCTPIDAAVLFAMVGEGAPTRVMEVGAGHTTHVIRHAMRLYDLPGELISIDPAPRIDVREVVDAAVLKPVQEIPADDFAIMQPGEILFVDSTHTFRPGGEIDYVLNTIIPRLVPGVIVGFHGIRLPRNYSAAELSSGFDEQEEVLKWLQSARPEILFSGGWLAEHHPGRLEAALAKISPGTRCSALWTKTRPR